MSARYLNIEGAERSDAVQVTVQELKEQTVKQDDCL